MARLPALMEYRCPSTPGTMADFGATSSALWEEMDVVTRAPPAREVHSRSPLSASKACCIERKGELQFLRTRSRSGVGAWDGRKSSSEGIDSLGNRTPDLSRAPFPASHSGGGRSFCFSLSLRGNTHHPAVDRLDENRQLHGLRGFRRPPAAIVTLRCPPEVQVLHYCVASRQCDTWTTYQDHQEYKEPQSCGLLCGRPGHGEGRSARGRGFDSRGSHPTRSHRYRPISALRCGSHRSRSALAAHSEKEFPFFHHNLEMFILFNECKFLGRMVCRCHVAILPFWGGMTLLETMNKV